MDEYSNSLVITCRVGGREHLAIVRGGVAMGSAIRVLASSEAFHFNNIMTFANCLDFHVCLKLMRGERSYTLHAESRRRRVPWPIEPLDM